VQLLDEEVQPLAQLAALGEQIAQGLQVGLKAVELFGHVDANGKTGGFLQATVVERFDAGLGAGQSRQRFFPAGGEPRLLALHREGHDFARPCGMSTDLFDAIEQQGAQTVAFERARRDQRGQGLLDGQAGDLRDFGSVGMIFLRAADEAQHFTDRERGEVRRQGAQGGIEGQQRRGGAGVGHGGRALRRFENRAAVDLAAAQRLGDGLPHGGFRTPQFFGQPEGDVEKAAVDRAQLDMDLGSARELCTILAVAGHAINWLQSHPLCAYFSTLLSPVGC
jgi:hypothetical protein